MPLEVHDYLVAQGWGGKGTGLRQGAISRPLAIPQKKNLAGLGKDRDEAFPFWDHLFSAAAKSIQLKCFSDDEEEGNEASTSNGVSMKKTSTGIFSTRRPVDGTPADSGSTTPNEAESDSQTSRLSLMALAKRDAAKRRLYAQFFRGPILGPETIAEEEKRLSSLVLEAFEKQIPVVQSVTIIEHIEVQTADERTVIDLEVSKSSEKKRKGKESGKVASESEEEDKDARKERKRRRKEEQRKKEDKEAAKLNRRKEKERKVAELAILDGSFASSSIPTEDGKSDGADKSERRRKKEEKKRLKALRNRESAVFESNLALDEKAMSEAINVNKPRKENLSSRRKLNRKQDETEQQDKKRKKKRKRENNPDDSS